MDVCSTTRTKERQKQEDIDEAADASVWIQKCGGALLEGRNFLRVGALPKSVREDLDVNRQDEISVRHMSLKKVLILEICQSKIMKES